MISPALASAMRFCHPLAMVIIFIAGSPLFAHGGYAAFVPLLAHMFVLLPLLALIIVAILINIKTKKKWLHVTVTALLVIGGALSALTIVYGFSRELGLSILLAATSLVIHGLIYMFSRWVIKRA